jgi:anti-sigma regulatory factor (Ser/Thr protein kinase)
MKTTAQHWRTSGAQLRGSVPRWLAERSFRQGDVPAVRQFTRAFGARARLDPARLADFVLAVSEAMACATAGGPCTARVRLWVTGTRAFCEVRGDGYIARRTSCDQRPGEAEALRGWLLQRLTDYVSVASGPDGAWVLLSMTVC